MEKHQKNLKRRPYLRSKFEDGDRPDGQDFTDLIDSSLNQKSDKIFAVDHRIGIGTETPNAPLEIVGKHKEINQSFLSTDGDNSTFRIAHPSEGIACIGVNQTETLQIGTFKKNGSDFKNHLTINKLGNIGIAVDEASEKLNVGGSVKIEKHLFINDVRLSVKKGKLYLKTCNTTYQILMKEVNSIPNYPNRKLATIVIIILFIILIILLLLIGYYYYTNTPTT